jgi:hypothetical protein
MFLGFASKSQILPTPEIASNSDDRQFLARVISCDSWIAPKSAEKSDPRASHAITLRKSAHKLEYCRFLDSLAAARWH